MRWLGSVLYWGMVLLLFVFMFNIMGHCQETPIYCQADVVKAMKDIWSEAGNGMTGVESSFIVDGTPQAYVIMHEKHTGEKMSQSVIVHRNVTFALFHVHPNGGGMWPSTPQNNYMGNGLGDTGFADKVGFDIYVVSRSGLTVYSPKTRQMMIVRQGLDWSKTKGCQ